MSDRLRLDLVLNDFVASAVSTGRITVLSDGTPWRPLIDVEGHGAGDRVGGRPGARAGGDFLIVNAGSDDWNYQVRDLADAVAARVPGHRRLDQPAGAGRQTVLPRRLLAVPHAGAATPAGKADSIGTVEALRQGLAAHAVQRSRISATRRSFAFECLPTSSAAIWLDPGVDGQEPGSVAARRRLRASGPRV